MELEWAVPALATKCVTAPFLRFLNSRRIGLPTPQSMHRHSPIWAKCSIQCAKCSYGERTHSFRGWGPSQYAVCDGTGGRASPCREVKVWQAVILPIPKNGRSLKMDELGALFQGWKEV